MPVTISELIASAEARLTRDRRSIALATLVVWASYGGLAAAGIGRLSGTAGGLVLLLSVTAAAGLLVRRGRFRRAGMMTAAAAIDRQLCTKDRVVSYLDAAGKDDPCSSEKRALIAEQLEQRIPAGFSPAVLRTAFPRRLRLCCLSLPVVYGVIAYSLLRRTPPPLPQQFTEPVAQQIAQLLNEEKKDLPPELVTELENLAQQIDENGLDSPEAQNALEASEETLSEARREGGGAARPHEDSKQNAPSPAPSAHASPTPSPTPTPPPSAEARQQQQQKDKQKRDPQAQADQQEQKQSSSASKQQSQKQQQQDGDGQGKQEQSKGSKGQQQNDGAEGEGQGEGQSQGQGGAEGDSDTPQQDKQGKGAGQGQGQEKGSEKGAKEGTQQGQGADGQGRDQKDQRGQEQAGQNQTAGQQGEKGNEQQDGTPQQTSQQNGAQGQQSQGQDSMQKAAEQLASVREQMEQQQGGDKNQEKQQPGTPAEGEKSRLPHQQQQKPGGADGQEAKKPDAAREKKTPGAGKGQGAQREQRTPEKKNAPGGGAAEWGSAKRNGEQEREGEGTGAQKTFEEVHIPGAQEKYDTRFTDQESRVVQGKRETAYRTQLKEVQLAKPEAIKEKAEQPIPLEYRDLLEQ